MSSSPPSATPPPLPPIPPPLPPRPLDYNQAGQLPPFGVAQTPGRKNFSVGSFIATTAVMSILLAIFVFVVPRLEVTFKDFGVKLPAITMAMLALGRLFSNPIGMFFGVIIALSMGLLVAVLPIRGRWLRLLLMTMLVLIVLGVALAVLLPLVTLMDSISQPGGKP